MQPQENYCLLGKSVFDVEQSLCCGSKQEDELSEMHSAVVAMIGFKEAFKGPVHYLFKLLYHSVTSHYCSICIQNLSFTF